MQHEYICFQSYLYTSGNLIETSRNKCQNSTFLCYYYSLVESHIDILCGAFERGCEESEEQSRIQELKGRPQKFMQIVYQDLV